MIILSKTHFSNICDHGEEAYPHECCGALFGVQTARKVTDIQRVENSWQDDKLKHRRFRITTQDYQNLEAYGKQHSLTLLGFYHTHPDHIARPSMTDLEYAWPFFSYIILSVMAGKAQEMNSFTLASSTEKLDQTSEVAISNANKALIVEKLVQS